MLSKAGLAVMDELIDGREATPAELATDTAYTKAHLYDVLDEMLVAGFVTERRGAHNRRRIQIAVHPVVEAYRHLVSKLGHIEWLDCLSPATLRVCWYLDTPRRVAAIADRLQLTRQGVHNALAPLKNRAMLTPSGPTYALSEDLQPLLAFARAVVTHDHRSRVRAVAPSATVAWCDPKRALVRVQAADDTASLHSSQDWEETGLAGFHRYGLEFFRAGEPAFWYAPDGAVSPAGLVCHTLVLDRGSRRVSYAMLLVETLGLDSETLVQTARWYDLAAEVSALLQSLDGEFETPADTSLRLPSEPEYMALKEQYGVA